MCIPDCNTLDCEKGFNWRCIFMKKVGYLSLRRRIVSRFKQKEFYKIKIFLLTLMNKFAFLLVVAKLILSFTLLLLLNYLQNNCTTR